MFRMKTWYTLHGAHSSGWVQNFMHAFWCAYAIPMQSSSGTKRTWGSSVCWVWQSRIWYLELMEWHSDIWSKTFHFKKKKNTQSYVLVEEGFITRIRTANPQANCSGWFSWVFTSFSLHVAWQCLGSCSPRSLRPVGEWPCLSRYASLAAEWQPIWGMMLTNIMCMSPQIVPPYSVLWSRIERESWGLGRECILPPLAGCLDLPGAKLGFMKSSESSGQDQAIVSL